MDQVRIARNGTEAVVQLHGAMTTASFLIGGRRIDPFYKAPWPRYPQDSLLDRLRGDFLCVPFGAAPSVSLPPGWGRTTTPPRYAHGFAANADWYVVDLSPQHVEVAIDYPSDQAVAQVGRTVRCASNGALVIDDRIVTRVDIALPIGVHPILRLPPQPGKASLELPPASRIATPPIAPEHSAQLLPGGVFTDPTHAPSVRGTSDLTTLPWREANEDLALLLDVKNPEFALVNHAEGYRVRLSWDGEILRHLLLWISNRGRPYIPWDGRNLCLGVEPITAAFDLGVDVSQAKNPLGTVTTVPLRAGEVTSVRHVIDTEDAS